MKSTRREFLRLSAVAFAGAALAACQPAAPSAPGGETAPEEVPEGEVRFEGKVELWPQTYTPTDDMEWSEDNPQPHNQVEVLADEYMEANPGVTLEIIRKPAQVADHEWIVTQQAGGTIPHIVWSHSFWIDSEIDKGWWVPLDPFMAEPNPYCKEGEPGSDTWLNQFYEVPTQSKRCPDGKLYVVPYDLVTTFFFYNQNIFDEAGVEAPTTWGEWMEALATLQDFGVIPYGHLDWYESQVGGMLYNKKSKEINPTGGVISLEMAACAIANGQYRATDAEYREWLEFIGEIVPFLAPDWAAEGADFNRKFLNQETAIFEDGSWRFGTLRANPLLEFEWSTFYAPTITPEDSPFATGEGANPIGGATAAQWAVTTRSEKENVLPVVIDILRYYSEPENAGRFIGELNSFLPNIKGVGVSLDLKDALQAVSEGLGEAGMLTYPDKVDTETREKMVPIWTDFKLGVLSLEDAQEQLDELMADYAEAAIAKNEWKCG